MSCVLQLCDFVAEFIKEYSRERRRSPSTQESVVDNPSYVVVFLIHVLAHSTNFPPKDCLDEKLYAQHFRYASLYLCHELLKKLKCNNSMFNCSPLFFMLLSLVNDKLLSGDKDLADDIVSSLLCIFRAIKKAEDAVDTSITYVSTLAFIDLSL